MSGCHLSCKTFDVQEVISMQNKDQGIDGKLAYYFLIINCILLTAFYFCDSIACDCTANGFWLMALKLAFQPNESEKL